MNQRIRVGQMLLSAATAVLLAVSMCPAASAQDGAGINADVTPPTVTSVTSSTANGTYKIGQVISVRVVFSEIVYYTENAGWAQIQLETGISDALVPYTSGSGTNTLQFDYTVRVGDSSADLDYLSTSALTLLSTATIKDSAGNNANRTLPSPGAVGSLGANKAIVVDGLTPIVSTITRQTPTRQLTNLSSVTWRVTFSEPIQASTVSTSDFTITDVSSSLTGESVTSVSPTTGTSSTIDVVVATGTGEGTLRLDVLAAASILDVAGNDYSSSFTTGSTFVIDRTPPTVTSVTRSTGGYTNAASVSWIVTFSESVNATTVSSSDFTLVDASSSITGESVSSTTPISGYSPTITVTANTGTGNGTLRLDVLAPATITDDAGNDYVANFTTGNTYTVDKTAPTVAGIIHENPSRQATNLSSVAWRVNFSENIQNETVSASDFTLTDVSGTLTGESITDVQPANGASDTSFIVTVATGTGEGELKIALNAPATILDLAGNDYNSDYSPVASTSYIIDRTAPTVVSVNRRTPTAETTNMYDVVFRVTFNEEIDAATVVNSDFTRTKTGSLTGDSTTDVTPDTGLRTTLDVYVQTGDGNGTMRLDVLAAAAFKDAAGNDYAANYTSGQAYILDRTLPTVVSVNRLTPAGATTNASSVTWRVTFSEAMNATTISTSDFKLVDVGSTLSMESISSSTPTTGSSTTIDVTANTGNNDGTLRLDVMGTESMLDVAGNDYNSDFTTGQAYTIDKTAPTVTSVNRVTPSAETTNASTVTWRITFSEPIDATTVGASDLTLTDVSSSITGESVTSTSPTTGTSATVNVTVNTGSGDGTLRLDVPSSATISDLGGNDYDVNYTSGQTYVIDKTPPTVSSITRKTPTGEFTNAASVVWHVVFNEMIDATTLSTADFALVDVTGTITGESKTSSTPTTGTATAFDVTVNTGSGGPGILRLNVPAAAVILDVAGNDYVANYSSGETFIIDKESPTVTIDQAAGQADPTSASPIQFTAVFSEAVTGFDSAGISLGGTAGATTAAVTDSGDHITYTVDVSGMTGPGTVTASVSAGAAVDSASNASLASSSTDNEVTYDNLPSTVTINQAAGQADPTNASTIQFTVVFNEAVTGFETGDVTLSGTAGATTAAVTDTGDHITYTVDVSGMTGDGTVIADIPADVAENSLGNPNLASTSTDNAVEYETAAPTVTVNQAAAQADPTNTSPIMFTAVFSEVVTDFADEDVALAGAAGPTIAVVTDTGDHMTYNIAVSGLASQGGVIASIPAGMAHDAAGNANAESTSTDNAVKYDTVAPTVRINQATSQPDPTNVSAAGYVVIFSERVTGFTADDVSIGGTAGGTLTATVNGTGSMYSVTIRGMSSSGTVVPTIAAGVALDLSGNPNEASTSTDNSVTYDNVSPTVTVQQADTQPDPTSDSPVNFTVVFSEPVTDFLGADVELSGAACPTTAVVTGSGTTYNVAVSGMSHSGRVAICVPSRAAKDAAGNPNRLSSSTDPDVQYEMAMENLVLTPDTGAFSTTPLTITTIYKDDLGFEDLKKAYLLINDTWSQANGVLLYYDRLANRVYLKNDANTSWGTGFVPGSSATLENSQCYLYVAETSAVGIGSQLVVQWRVAMKSPFNDKNLNGYMYCQNAAGKTRGWDLMGIYYNIKPKAISIVPDDEILPIDTRRELFCRYDDPNGWEDIKRCYLVVCENLSFKNAMFLYYDRANNRLYLKNDDNTSWGTGYAPGTDVVLSNSQCEFYVKDFTATGSDYGLMVMWPYKLKPSMSGKNLYSWMYVMDQAGLTDGWKRVGIHFKPEAPACVSVTPSDGNFWTDSASTVVSQYSDANGNTDIGLAYLQLSVTSSQANAVFLMYDAKQNKVFLRNDANTAWGAGIIPGSGDTLENSQCIVHGDYTSVALEGTQNLTVNWRITLKASQVGKLLAERMYCRDNEQMNSGWKLMGYVRGQ